MERVADGVRYKLQSGQFLIFDHEAIEKHLEAMAAKGWIFQGFNSLNYWEYKQDEPQKLKYAVAYIPDANTDGTLNEAQQDMDALCAQAGWQRVASLDAAQIYCSTLENPVPIETDEWSRLEVMKKSMRKGLGRNFLLMVLWGMNLLLRGNLFMNNPVEVLADPAKILLMVILVILIIRWGLDIVLYNLWIKKSKEAVTNGGACSDFEWIYSANDWIAPVVLLFTVATVYVFDSHWGMVIFFLFMLGVFLFAGEWAKIKSILKRTGEVSRKRTVKIIACYTIVLACFVITAAEGVMQPEIVENPKIMRQNETFIASEEIGRLETAPAYYEKYEVKAGFLYDWLLTKWLEAETYGGYYTPMSEKESEEWGMKGYVFYNDEGQPRDEWAFEKEREFVKVLAGESRFTTEQKQAAIKEIGFK